MALFGLFPTNEKDRPPRSKRSTAVVPSRRAVKANWQYLAWHSSSQPDRGDAEKAPDLSNRLTSEQRLDPILQSRMERGFGTKLGHIRVHTGTDAAQLADSESARAVTVGENIVFGSGEYRPGMLSSDLLIAHEVAHALQQRGRGAAIPGGMAEDRADQAAVRALARISGGNAPPANAGLAQSGGLALQRCSRSKSDVQRALDGEIAWTPTLAQQALDQYRSMSDSERQRTFERYYPTGAFAGLLRALPPGAASASGAYNDIIQDILRRAQRAGALESARASGLSNEAQMAQTQADFMRARNEAAARAALPPGAPPPTAAQAVAQQQTQVAQTSIAPSFSTLTPAEVTNWTNRANTAVTDLVNYARAHFPELNLTAADLYVDIVGVENRGQGVIAYGSEIGGRHVAVVGRTFVRYVEANPAYALSTVMHEVRGHPEYGPYAQPDVEYGLTLYDLAAARMPGYTQPTGQGRRSEIDAYAYQETEIYSLLRQIPYHAPLDPAHSALQADYPDPERWVRDRIALIKQQWEPRIAKALLRGLYQRLRLDPRLQPAALRAFERAVRASYTGAESAIANDILR